MYKRQEQDEELDRLQAHALRYIFGKDMSYKKMRDRAGVTTLRERRVELCDKFASKCLKSDRFRHWFPRRVPQRVTRVRPNEQYIESFARCERLRNSPLHFMRRRLNGKEGKVYGKRNGLRRGGGESRDSRVYVPRKKRRLGDV